MKKHFFKAIAAVMALSMLSACSSTTSNSSSTSNASTTSTSSNQAKTLVMATEAGFAPYEYLSGSDIVGIDVDIAKEIAKAMNAELKVDNMKFDTALLSVQNGKADFVAAGVSINEERKAVMDFSIEYATSKQVLVTKKDGGMTSPDEINKDKKIGVQLGTVADLYLQDEGLTPVTYEKYTVAAQSLKNGTIDAIMMDELPAKELVKANEEFVVLEKEVFTDKYAIGVKKGNTELLNQINTVLQKLIDEGKINEYTLAHTAG